MSLLYINEDGAVVGVDGNRLTVKYSNGLLRSVPMETVDSITILGQSQLTTQCIKTCLEKGFLWLSFPKAENILGICSPPGMWMLLCRESRVLCMRRILR